VLAPPVFAPPVLAPPVLAPPVAEPSLVVDDEQAPARATEPKHTQRSERHTARAFYQLRSARAKSSRFAQAAGRGTGTGRTCPSAGSP